MPLITYPVDGDPAAASCASIVRPQLSRLDAYACGSAGRRRVNVLRTGALCVVLVSKCVKTRVLAVSGKKWFDGPTN